MEASIDTSFQSMHKPDYPREALQQEITGTVILLITVSESGEPINVKIEKSSHNRYLDKAAVDAAQKWRFNPGMHDGKRVGGVVRVPVVFNL